MLLELLEKFHMDDNLAEKIGRLAALTSTLRSENAQLRLSITELTTENKQLRTRMQEAHDRVETVLTQFPQESTE